MTRSAAIVASLLFVGCASAPSRDLLVAHPESRPDEAPAAEHASTPSVTASELAILTSPSVAPEALPVAYGPAIAPPDEGLRHSRFTIKGGLYSAEEDAVGDGPILNLSWMRFFTRFLALELELGYFSSDGDSGGVEVDVWGIPAMVNGRLNVPLWILDLYGGAGLGGFYYDAEAEAGGLSADDDGFLLGGNLFLGATLNLADAIAAGLEAKYYLTEEIDDFDEALDAFALMLTLGFSR